MVSRKATPILALIILLLVLAVSSGSRPRGEPWDEVALPYTFNLLSWEATSLFSHELGRLKPWDSGNISSAQEVEQVRRYFAEKQERPIYRDEVAGILRKQTGRVLEEEGFALSLDPWRRTRFLFPPLAFELGPLPQILVISPRDKIALKAKVLLRPDLRLEEIEAIERRTEDGGVSALI
ncbi:MAG: hypothetical protein Q8O76_14470, partial [Chloroflexota bacterium]|nr:hypothetical protein [Chloroflexota bacterium]